MRGNTITHAPQHYQEITKLSKNLETECTTFSLILRVGIVSSLNLKKFGNVALFVRFGF